jgi:hypothetical protein
MSSSGRTGGDGLVAVVTAVDAGRAGGGRATP